MSGRVTSCHVMSRHITSCHIMSSCHVMSSHVLSRLVMSRLVMSCHVESHVTHTHVMSRHITSCHIYWPRRRFRNRGPVRESGSERRSRCGAACTASVRVWGRAHFCRVWVGGCGVFEACRGCAAGVSRCCAVGIEFRARFVHAWSTCVSRGRVRGSCVLEGVLRTCRGHAGGALSWGLDSGRVAHAHDFCALRPAFRVKGVELPMH